MPIANYHSAHTHAVNNNLYRPIVRLLLILLLRLLNELNFVVELLETSFQFVYICLFSIVGNRHSFCLQVCREFLPLSQI